MTKAVTAPSEWRRRAGLAGARPGPPWLDALREDADLTRLEQEQGHEGGWPGPSGRLELAPSALNGWACLEGDRPEPAARAAHFCRRLVWEQPDDVLGFLVGWEDGHPAEPLVEAHAAGQHFGDLGAGTVFLARRFEETGDDDDLDAAIELHDVVVALGEGVWEPVHLLVGWGGAVLYRVTGEDAFLATAERMADLLCETQLPDGTWGDDDLTAGAAAALTEMADAVEARQAVGE